MSRCGWLVSIGSNIDPEQNIPAIINELLVQFGRLTLSPLVYTDPYGIESNNTFINGVLYLESELDAAAIKARFNAIEELLGRDRSLDDSKQRDRTADIDILCPIERLEQGVEACLPPEPYLRPLFLDLLGKLGMGGGQVPQHHPRAVELPLAGVLLGKTAATIDRDGGTGHVVVVE